MLRLTLIVCFAPLLATSFTRDRQDGTFLGATVATSDAEAEVSEQRFLVAQWQVLESELLQLQSALAEPGKNSTGKNSTAKEEKPSKNSTAKQAPLVPSAKVQVATKHKDSEDKVHDDIKNKLSMVKGLMKGKMGTAMLKPMLAMLKGLYEDQKKRIGDLNKKEEQSKKRYADQKAAFDKRIQHIKDDVTQHKFSSEFGANQTRDYTQQFKYWEGVRARDHKQFHNALKITHGLMAKEKDTIKQYEKAIASHKDEEDEKHDQFVNGIMKTLAAHKKDDKDRAEAKKVSSDDMPEVVLFQFCQDALTEVRQHLKEIAL